MNVILIELPTWLGDSVMASPAIENILINFPNHEIIFLGSKVTSELYSNHPRQKRIIPISRSYLRLVLLALSLKDIDIFISMRSSLRTRFFGFFLQANKKFFYQKNKLSSIHQVQKYNEFVHKNLNISIQIEDLKLFKSIQQKNIFRRPVIGINPGAAYGEAKCWPIKKYVELAHKLSKDFDIVIFGGIKETQLCNEVEELLSFKGTMNVYNFAGKTNLSELIEIISHLKVFVTGDSGPMHIAAAMKIPTISIFGPTDPIETCQWKNKKSKIISKKLSCQPCLKRVCPLKHHNCMNLISAIDVYNETISLI